MGLSPFRFEKMWIQNKDFSNKIKEWCHVCSFEGSGGYCFLQKLKHSKGKLKIWNADNSGQLGAHKEDLINSIKALDLKEEEWGLMKKKEIIDILPRDTLK